MIRTNITPEARRSAARSPIAAILAAACCFVALRPAAANEFSWENIDRQQRRQMQELMRQDQDRREREAREAPYQTSDGGGVGLVFGVIAAGVIACAIVRCLDERRTEPAPMSAPPAAGPPPVPAQQARAAAAAQSPAPTYRVVRVPRHDVLNMRHLPAGEIIGAIPPDGRGVTLGDCAYDWKGLTWCVATYGAQRGWVASAYLRQE
jgi:hypothetical protein